MKLKLPKIPHWLAAAGSMAIGGLGGLATEERIRGLKKEGDRRKSYIEDAYQIAQQRMGAQQSEGTQSNLEALNARGLAGGGTITSPIAAAMANGQTPGATDLASASRSRLAGEYKLDRKALNSAHTQALDENKADTLNSYINFGKEAIGTAASFAGIPGLGNAGGAASAAPAQTPIAAAMLSGSAWEGVNPVDPLGEPSSSWHVPQGLTLPANGLRNSDFNTSGVA